MQFELQGNKKILKGVRRLSSTYKDSFKCLHNYVIKGQALLIQMVSSDSDLCCEITSIALEGLL